ncbi:MAG: hypothetical protein WCJ71_00435 [Candidatus Omnitrophota bacterium]
MVKSIGLGFLVAGLIAVSPELSLARNAHSREELKILNDSAAALKKINPALTEKMVKYAAEEEKESKGIANVNDDSVENEKAGVAFLRNVAKVLKVSDPELSNGLTRYAEKEDEEIAEMK